MKDSRTEAAEAAAAAHKRLAVARAGLKAAIKAAEKHAKSEGK